MNQYLNRIIALFLLTILTLSSHAQQDSTHNSVYGFFVLFPIEFPNISNNGMNGLLESNNLPTANFHKANPGIGLQFYGNRFITIFSFNKFTKKNDQGTSLLEVEYRSTSLNFGYDLTRSKWYSIYPYVGFKGSGLNYLYQERISDETSIEDYLQTDLIYKEITNSKAHLDLGMGISHQWFYLVSFRFGYLIPLEKTNWNISNNQVNLTDFPNINYNFYFSLTLGLGAIGSDNDIRRHYESQTE